MHTIDPEVDGPRLARLRFAVHVLRLPMAVNALLFAAGIWSSIAYWMLRRPRTLAGVDTDLVYALTVAGFFNGTSIVIMGLSAGVVVSRPVRALCCLRWFLWFMALLVAGWLATLPVRLGFW